MQVVTFARCNRGDEAEIDPDTRMKVEAELEEALKRHDVSLLLSCLRQFCQAYGMSYVAREMGIDRSLLYRMLKDGSNPKIGNVLSLLQLFAIRLHPSRNPS